MNKKLYLILTDKSNEKIVQVFDVPRSAGPQTKYYADGILRQLDAELKEKHNIYVVVSADEVCAGAEFNADTMQVCFALL